MVKGKRLKGKVMGAPKTIAYSLLPNAYCLKTKTGNPSEFPVNYQLSIGIISSRKIW
jgi:hypothetical protein